MRQDKKKLVKKEIKKSNEAVKKASKKYETRVKKEKEAKKYDPRGMAKGGLMTKNKK